jgi:hypothetical protein
MAASPATVSTITTTHQRQPNSAWATTPAARMAPAANLPAPQDSASARGRRMARTARTTRRHLLPGTSGPVSWRAGRMPVSSRMSGLG